MDKKNEEFTLERLLCLNDPIRLGLVGYIFDRRFMEERIHNFEGLGFDATDRINSLSAPEIKKIISFYNPSFDADHSGVRMILEKLVLSGFLGRETKNELGPEGKKYRRRVVYYFPTVSEDIQNLARYIMNSVIDLELDYEKSITDRSSLGRGTVVNSRRWELIKSLSSKPKSIKQLVDSTSITYDGFYNVARPLAEAELIYAPYLGRDSRVIRYIKTHKFHDKGLRKKFHKDHENKFAILDDHLLLGVSFTDTDLHKILSDNYRSAVIRFRARLHEFGMIRAVNNACGKFEISPKGLRLYNFIITQVDRFFEEQVLPSKITYSNYLLKKAFEYDYKS
jgi:hypothetical protein